MKCKLNLLLTCIFSLSIISICSAEHDWLDMRCDKLLDFGFKNAVCKLKSEDLVARMGFVNDGPTVISVNLTVHDEYSELIDELRSVIERTKNDIYGKYQLEYVRDNMQYNKNPRFDIATNKEVEHETSMRTQACSIPATIFGIMVPYDKDTIPLPWIYKNTNISLVLEYNALMDGNILSASLSYEEILKLLIGYLDGQLNIHKTTGYFHIDAHTKNMLFKRDELGEILFMWSDFGRTSASSDARNQFLNSIASFHNFVKDEREKYEKLEHIVYMFKSLHSCIGMTSYSNEHARCLGNGLKELQSYIASSSNSTELSGLVSTISPTTAFAYESLNQRMDNQAIMIAQQTVLIDNMTARMDIMAAQIKKLFSANTFKEAAKEL